MIDRRKFFSDLPFSVEAAKQKSFTQAAVVLDIPLPTPFRRIAVMEKSLGVRLFNRNSRNVGLTEAGRNFFESCASVVSEGRNALGAVPGENLNRARVTGRLP